MAEKRIAILGGGIAGCIAAIIAKKKGLFPIIIESRSYLGFEMTGRYQLFVRQQNSKKYILERYFDINGNSIDSNKCYYQGELKMALGRRMRELEIPCFYLSHLIGISGNTSINKIYFANPYGMYSVDCNYILDCSNTQLIQNVLGFSTNNNNVHSLQFAMELSHCHYAENVIKINLENSDAQVLKVHPSKHSPNSRIVTMDFNMTYNENSISARTEAEIKARIRSLHVLNKLAEEEEFKKFKLINISSEVSSTRKNLHYHCDINNILENEVSLNFDFTEADLLQLEMFLNNRFDNLCSCDESISENYFWMNGKKRRLSESVAFHCSSEWLGVKLNSITLITEQLPIIDNDITIAGMGVSGMSAAMGIGASAKSVLGIENQSTLGGTRTAAHVTSYYCGYRGGFTKTLNELFQEFLENNIKFSYEKTSMYIMLEYFHFISLEQMHFSYLLNTVVCGTKLDGKRLIGVIVANDTGVYLINSKIFLDMTGNGDLAALSGAAFEFGDPQDGNSQTFSRWGRTELSVNNYLENQFHGDYDAVDPSNYQDMLRALTISQCDNSAYYFSHPLAYREGRRIIGKEYITLEKALTFRDLSQIVLISETTLDNHGRMSADYALMGFGTLDKVYRAAFPLGCFIPKDIDGLLVGGKAISGDRDAVGMARMNADIQNAGFMLGIYAGLTQGGDLESVDFENFQNKLRQLNILTKERETPTIKSAHEAVSQISNDDPYCLFDVLLQEKHAVLPLLRTAYEQENNIQRKYFIAKALAWFADPLGIDLLYKRFDELIHNECSDTKSDIDDHRDIVRHGVANDYVNDYWDLNQLIVLFERLKDQTKITELCDLIERANAGGTPYRSKYIYYATRVDMVCVPYFERLYILAHYFIHLPSKKAAPYLFDLLGKENIGGGLYCHNLDKPPLYFSSYLELMIARAAYRCGESRAREVIRNYSFDLRKTLSDCAKNELSTSKVV
ncbi:MAG: FAD-dependent oxidoreductase [Lachnospiraceae bacterium]|nr:FAD-dependent oxidoreductase [Lachnospiraceae bacterium]